MTWLQGYRTYILAGFAILIILASWSGVIDVNTANSILSILGFSTIIALRSAIANS